MKIAQISGLLLLLLSISVSAMQRPSEVQQKIDAIKLQYQLSQLPSQKAPVACLTQQEINTGLACFVSGYQNVYVINTQKIPSFDKNIQALFAHLNVAQIIIGNETIFFTPNGKRNALLLAELKLNEAITRLQPQSVAYPSKNQYLVRTLLGYQKEDIKKAYIEEAFTNWYGTVIKGPALDAIKRQQTLNGFKQDIWQKTNDYTNYLEDKFNAEEWLQDQGNKDIQYLENQVAHLKSQLGQRTSYLQRLRTWWSTAPSLKWTQWWK